MNESEYPLVEGPVYAVLDQDGSEVREGWRVLPLGTTMTPPFAPDPCAALAAELAALRGAARCHVNQWDMQPEEVSAWLRALRLDGTVQSDAG